MVHFIFGENRFVYTRSKPGLLSHSFLFSGCVT